MDINLVAKKWKVTRTTVVNACREHGLKVQVSREEQAARRKKMAMFAKKNGVDAAAQEFGVSIGTVYAACRENGINLVRKGCRSYVMGQPSHAAVSIHNGGFDSAWSLFSSSRFHFVGGDLVVFGWNHSCEHSFRVADRFVACEDAVAIAIDFFGMSFQEAAHRTSRTTSTVQFSGTQLVIVVGVIASEGFGGFADNFVSADDLVLIEIDLIGMNENPRLTGTIAGLWAAWTASLTGRTISLWTATIAAGTTQFIVRNLSVVVFVEHRSAATACRISVLSI